MYFKEATIPGVLSNCHALNYMHKISTSTCTYKCICTHVLIMALRFRDLQNCVILSSCLILKHIHNYTLS